MTFSCYWDGNGQVYISGNENSITGVYADDGFTITVEPSGAVFDAQPHYATQHNVIDLTSGMTPGTTNTFTLVVDNWNGLSMSYGWISGVTFQTPYIVEDVSTPPTTVPTTLPTMIPSLNAQSVTVNPPSPEFGQEYTVSVNVNDPTTTQTSGTITTTEVNDTYEISDKEWIPSIPYTATFSNPPEIQPYLFSYLHTADPFEPLEEEGYTKGPMVPLETVIEDSVSNYLNVWEIADISGSEVAGWASAIMTQWDTHEFIQDLGCTPTASYTYSFSSTSVTNLNPITVQVTAPFWKYMAFENGIGNEVLSLVYSYLSDYASLTGPEGAPISFVFNQGAMLQGGIAEWMFQTAVDPSVDYTQPIVPVQYTISGLDAIPDGPMKNYALQLEITATHARALRDATINYNAALLANDTVWETTLLKERYEYQSVLSDDFNSLQILSGPMCQELQNDGINLSYNDIESIKQNISQNGLPQQEISLLESNGYSDSDIHSVQNLTLMVPDDVVVNYSASINNLLSASEYFNAVTLENITSDLGSQAPPYANFIASTTTGTAPLTVQFTDISRRSPSQWVWNFGDGATATTENVAHTYTTAGIYTVNLTVTNSTTGSDTRTKYDYITVYPPPPVANFTANVTSGQLPLAVAFTDTSTNSPTQWAWDFGDGSNSTAQSPVHVYSTPGNYTVALNATNAGGSNTIIKPGYITVRPIPWKVQIFPNVINLNSKGVFVGFVEIPKPYDANNVVKATVVSEGAPAISLIRIGIFPRVFAAIFQTSALKGVKPGNKVSFTVTGEVKYNGNLLDFSGSDNVTVINVTFTTHDNTEDISSWSAADIFAKGYNNK
jgi:PKD repeat protein